MTINELQSNIEEQCFINDSENTKSQKKNFYLKDVNKEYSQINEDQIVFQKSFKDKITKKDKYNVILYNSTSLFSGTLENFFNSRNLKLKKNVKDITFDLFLVGGGSSGSCCFNTEAYPRAGSVIYEKQLNFDVNDNIEIMIGKGGKGFESEFFNSIIGNTNDRIYFSEVPPNKGGNTIFTINNQEYIAEGGGIDYTVNESLLKEYNITRINSVDKYYGTANPAFTVYEFTYYGQGVDPVLKTLSKDNLDKRCAMYGSASEKYIPYTNIPICTSGVLTKLPLNLDDSTSVHSKHIMPFELYGYSDRENKSVHVIEWDGNPVYINDSLSRSYNLEMVESLDNYTYGGSGGCANIAPYYNSLSLYDLLNFQESLKKYLKNYQFYRGRIGSGGNGVCAIIVRSDYFES